MKNQLKFSLLTALFALVAISAECRSIKGYYTFNLEDVVCDTTTYKGINVELDNQPKGCTSAICKVKNINFRWVMNPTHFDLIVVNGSRDAVKILWGESSVTMPNGKVLKVTNNVKQYDANQQFITSIVRRGAIFSGVVVPVDRIKSTFVIETINNPGATTNQQGTKESVDQSFANKKKYSVAPLLGEYNKGLSDGKMIKTTLAVEVEGVVHKYEFNLKLSYTKDSVEVIPTSQFLLECIAE